MPIRLIMTATKMDAIIMAPIIMTILEAEAVQAEEASVQAEAKRRH